MERAEKAKKADEEQKPLLTERISVELSDREIALLGAKLAETRLNQIAIDKEFSAVKSEFSAKLRALGVEIDLLAKQVNARVADVDIAVEEIHDDDRKMVIVVRHDTGDVLRTREMTAQERGAAFTRRQHALPGILDGTDLVDEADRAVRSELHPAWGGHGPGDLQDPTDRQDAALAAERPFLSDENEDAAARCRGCDHVHKGRDLAYICARCPCPIRPRGFAEEGPDDEEPVEDDDDPGPIRASDEEEPPEARPTDPLPPPTIEDDFIEHKGQHLRRVVRSPKDNGQPEAPKR
jgi:hypothetical protein